jgi:Na+-transporting NADH:ubiquinone oxidoreductase subunit B
MTHRGFFSHRIKDGKFEGVTEATPLLVAKDLRLKAYSENATDKDYNEYMKYVKAELPRLFWGNRSGSMGETCSALLILGGIFLIAMRVANWRTMLSTIFAGALIGFLLYEGKTIEDKLYLTAFALLSGGFLFGAVFMVTDPVTGPATQTGRYFYGFAIGGVTMLIRRFSGYPEGIMFAILLLNIFASLIDEVVIAIRYRRSKS